MKGTLDERSLLDLIQEEISAPLADFFGVGVGRQFAFENEHFSSPTGTSRNCYIPMPFRKGARITLTNGRNSAVRSLFYDIDYNLSKSLGANVLYIHTHWRRENPTKLGRDFEILPLVKEEGRFLGCNIVVNTNPLYGVQWWGEGEVKVYLDGDKDHPTLAGTGTEDYIGGGFGMKKFFGRYQGCWIAEGGTFGFYRFHVPDPIYFHKDCRVTIQQMGIGSRESTAELLQKNVPLRICGAWVERPDKNVFVGLLEKTLKATLDDCPENARAIYYYRQDDVRAVAYYYLNKPTDNLDNLLAMPVHK